METQLLLLKKKKFLACVILCPAFQFDLKSGVRECGKGCMCCVVVGLADRVVLITLKWPQRRHLGYEFPSPEEMHPLYSLSSSERRSSCNVFELQLHSGIKRG